MEMEDQYALSDLRQFISRASVGQFPPYAQQQQHQQPMSDFMTAHHHHHRGLTPTSAAAAVAAHQNQSPFDMVVMNRHVGATAAGVNTVDMLHNRVGSSSVNHQHLHPYQDHFNCDSTTTTATVGNNSGGFDCPDGGAARWPRQETLTLLEIRSRLDHKFKEANQKGPLWDEVARIMSEEHGYQRSGKKCREKFENLYKYYKKTKEGKAGRQDGKHYRFFRQLEALYGEHHHNNTTSLPTPILDAHIVGNAPQFSIPTQQNSSLLGRPPPRGDNTSASFSNSSEFEVSSSEDDELNGSMESNGSMERKKKRRGKRSWKAKIKEFIDLQMRKIMEKQEAWLEKMMKTLENREHERMAREDEWRKSEADRVEREHKFWANERAWIEARDSALMTALEKLNNNNNSNNNNNNNNGCGEQWPEPEVTRLIQLRTSMDSRFLQCGFSEEVLWEDIAAKMAYFGYERSALVCKEKWDCINKYFQDKSIKDEGKKKRKENYGGGIHNNHDLNDQGAGVGLYMNHQLAGFTNCEINEPRLQLNEGSSSPSSHNSNVNASASASASASAVNPAGTVMNDSCLRFFLGDGESLGWESNYALKLNKGDHN